jgi:hypothetical protein
LKKSKKEVQPNWHPNFRIQSELPDIKPIRTGFLINSAAVVICVALGFLVLQQELRRMNLNGSISELKATVKANEATNRSALKNSKEFVDKVKRIQEVESFYEAPTKGFEFLIGLAEIRPENLIYDNINFTESVRVERRNEITTFRVQITGQSRDMATLGEFKDFVSELPFVVRNNGNVNETILPRDENTGVFPFTLVVDFEPDAKS